MRGGENSLKLHGRQTICRKASATATKLCGRSSTVIFFVSIFHAAAESLKGENASRLAAMERADKKNSDLLEGLNGNYHRLRQSRSDEELFDVISGFEALSK